VQQVFTENAPRSEKDLTSEVSIVFLYAMAQKAVEVAADVMKGKKPETEPVLVPVSLVTRERIDDYKGWTK
jgi:ABC-type sugar transport system substrate-binding protein